MIPNNILALNFVKRKVINILVIGSMYKAEQFMLKNKSRKKSTCF